MADSENNSGGSGWRFGYGPSRLKERKRLTASDIGNGKAQHDFMESDLAEGCSQLVGKKHCRDNDSLQTAGSPDQNEENIPGKYQEEVILSKAMEDDIQQLRERVDCFTHQVSELLEAGKAYFLDASTVFEEGILQLHQKVLETWEEEIEGLRNVDIVNEEICTRLREARNVLEKLQSSVAAVHCHRGSDLPNIGS